MNNYIINKNIDILLISIVVLGFLLTISNINISIGNLNMNQVYVLIGWSVATIFCIVTFTKIIKK